MTSLKCYNMRVANPKAYLGEMEFDTSKIGKVEDPRTGGYMLTAENEGYNLAKEERLRKENELVHRVMHPLFN
jgi:hypothetical protein